MDSRPVRAMHHSGILVGWVAICLAATIVFVLLREVLA